jgi:nitrite reductase/ring-hydroxylating ferredoxin subunit
MATTVAFRALDDAGKLPDNYVNPYYLEDLKRRVSVARAGGKLYAFDDLCKHEGCPLSSGLLTGTTLMCQCHGSKYDITSGAVLQSPHPDRAPRVPRAKQPRSGSGEDSGKKPLTSERRNRNVWLRK